tara:strand:- start:15 stop:251 length:237 start_codon:yes stop_codon:yes gene_type:complete
MSDYDNTNSGALFKNNTKEEGDNRPDMTGVVDVEGKEYRVSAWSNTSKNGMKYLSLKVSEKQEGQQMQSQKNDEEMPF